jgi:peroxiredoxin
MDQAPRGIRVTGTSGGSTVLDELWTARPLVLCFVRHFGCIFCRQQVAGLCRKTSEMEAAGASLVFVGSGTPLMARAFEEAHCPRSRVFVDPKLESFRAFGLCRGLATSLNGNTVLKAIRAYRDGHRQIGVQGDPWQQGGVFVVDTTGRVRYSYISRFAGDHPSPSVLVDALASV